MLVVVVTLYDTLSTSTKHSMKVNDYDNVVICIYVNTTFCGS